MDTITSSQPSPTPQRASAAGEQARIRPAIVVLSTLFPSAAQPVAGIFVKERMFRVAKQLPMVVISPQPWFPLQSLIRRWKPEYRPPRAEHEVVDGVEIFRPRFISLPAALRRFDGFWVAVTARRIVARLVREGRADVLDVHFGYPDGYAGALLAKWFGLPWLVTLRGKEERLREAAPLRERMARAMRVATRVVGVSSALRQVGIELGAEPARSLVIGNGIDLAKFFPVDAGAARAELGIAADAEVIVSVGGLVERKGFHRIIEVMPELTKRHPKLLLLVIGGPGPEGDWSQRLADQVRRLQLEQHVRFLGQLPPEQLRVPLSAADVFVLATRYEGWANVFLEAMACGLPVVTTQVGGNAEVVARADLGIVVPFGDAVALSEAIERALRTGWDRSAIRRYAQDNAWERRIDALVDLFDDVYRERAAESSAGARSASP